MEKHLKFEDYANDLDIPKEWKDTTWRSDITPSFEYLNHRIWIDHPDPKESEYGEPSEGEPYYRFNITKDVWDDQKSLFETHDFNEVLKYMEALNGLTWDQYANDLAIPDGWKDVSYGNDACPSFAFEGYQIFHDHPNPDEREIPEWERFRVIIESQYGEHDGWALATDDFNEVLEAIKTPFGKRMKFEVRRGLYDNTNTPRIVTVDDLINNDEWDIDLMNTVVSSGDFIEDLGQVQNGEIYEYIDYSGSVFFKKLPQS